MATPLFWLLWCVGSVGFALIFARGLARPVEMIGLPFVFAVFGAYFYVFVPLQVAFHLSGFLPPFTLEIGHLCVVLALASLWLGWWLTIRRHTPPDLALPQPVDRHLLFRVGIVSVVAGVAGNWTFLSFGSEGFGESGYWYMLFQVAYPGAAACIIALVQDRSLRTPLNYTVLVGSISYLLVPYLIWARRGPTMAWVLTLMFSAVLGSRRTPSRRAVTLGLAAAGSIALTILAARKYLDRGESVTDSISAVSFEDVALRRTRQVADNEYVYHCALVGTTYLTGRYQYGTGHLGVLFNAIPRAVWPEKPGRGAGLFPDARALMPSVTGISMGRGMAAGPISDSFVQYGFLFPLFWGLLGWLGGLVWRRALHPDDWYWKVTLVNVLACTHWLVAQSFVAFAVPLLFGQAVPVLGWLYTRHVSAAAQRGSAGAIGTKPR